MLTEQLNKIYAPRCQYQIVAFAVCFFTYIKRRNKICYTQENINGIVVHNNADTSSSIHGVSAFTQSDPVIRYFLRWGVRLENQIKRDTNI